MPKKWGNVDFRAIKRLAKRLEKADQYSDQIILKVLYEAANRVLRKTKKRTPVGVYKDGHTGGTLRRNWYITDVQKKGNTLYIEINNPTEYGPFVEYGHRKKNNKGWVEGKFMLTISMSEVEAMLPKITDRHMKEALGRLFDD